MSESEPIKEIDNMGREKTWEEPNLSVKLFKEICCENCSCK